MKYEWKNQDEYKIQSDQSSQEKCLIEILTIEEFRQQYPDIFRRAFVSNSFNHIRFCKADWLKKAVTGTFAIPPKEDPSQTKICFGYCLMEDKIIFIDDSNYVKSILDEMQSYQLVDISSASLCLFEFMEYLLKDDMIFLQKYEERLTQLEEKLLKGESDDFDFQILSSRKDLSALSAYYEQLSDMGETLQQSAAERREERDRLLFGLYADKAGRLYSTVQMLKEYSMQLREMHQAQVDMRQNEIMKFLTIVTTIFMPLSLIAGWYGMNFINMPELSFPYGYIIICLICLLIIVIEIWVFRIKKWFK